jgi:hypothetical protein
MKVTRKLKKRIKKRFAEITGYKGASRIIGEYDFSGKKNYIVEALIVTKFKKLCK